MTGTSIERSHEAVVDAWLAGSIDHGSSAEIVRLFHAAFEAIWSAAVETLGSVTLSAIAERVFHTTTERYTFLFVVPKTNGSAHTMDRLHERLTAVPRADLIEGLRFGLIELMSVIGTLTAEILREDMHSALESVTPATIPRAMESPAIAIQVASTKAP